MWVGMSKVFFTRPLKCTSNVLFLKAKQQHSSSCPKVNILRAAVAVLVEDVVGGTGNRLSHRGREAAEGKCASSTP